MVDFYPFRAIRYGANAGLMPDLICPPYDVISKNDEKELDGYEGVDYNYYQKEYFTFKGKKILVYVQKVYYFQKPNSTYLHTIIEGYKDCGLDIKKLKKTISKYETNYVINW